MFAKRPGVVVACGLAKGGGLPVNPKHVDSAGDCVYPARIQFPSSAAKTRFVKVAADVGIFAALDLEGHLWVWGMDNSGFPAQPTKVPTSEKVVDCAVGRTFVALLVGEQQRALHLLGSVGHSNSKDASLNPGAAIPFGDSSSPCSQIDACNDALLVLTQAGAVYALGKPPTTGLSSEATTPTLIPALASGVASISVGSRHAAAVGTDGTTLWVWGEGTSGNLGLGKRVPMVQDPTKNPFFAEKNLRIRSVGCTRGQPRGSADGKPGQEGPRMHVVTEDGKLWVAGTTHKGMGADCLNKTFMPEQDHLTFYAVGGPASDFKKWKEAHVLTGAAEDLTSDPVAAARRMGMDSVDLYGKSGMTNYLANEKIIWSVPSHIHSMALAESGRLFCWGCGSDGRTGLRAYMRGPGGSKRTMKCYVSTPSAVEALEGHEVLAAAVGRFWTVAIVDDSFA